MRRVSPKAIGIYTAVSLILVGLLFSIASVVILVKDKDAVYEKVEATIVRIEEDYDTINEEYTHSVFVDYEVDGIKYTDAPFGAYNSKMKVGDTVTGQYDVNTPELIQAEGSENVPYIVGGVGLVVLAFGIFKLIKALQNA